MAKGGKTEEIRDTKAEAIGKNYGILKSEKTVFHSDSFARAATTRVKRQNYGCCDSIMEEF